MSEVAFSVATPMALALAGIIHLTKKVCHADDAWADENGGARSDGTRLHRQRNLSRLGVHTTGREAIPERAKARNITEEHVIKDVLLHAQPRGKFVTTQEIGLALSLRSTAAASGLSIHPADIGWLLVACAPAQSGAILTLIQAAGINEARIVGEMVEGSGAVVS